MTNNLSSTIILSHIDRRLYQPENAIEQTRLTRLEKIPTHIYESAKDGSAVIARHIADKMQQHHHKGAPLILSMIEGKSMMDILSELDRLCQLEHIDPSILQTHTIDPTLPQLDQLPDDVDIQLVSIGHMSDIGFNAPCTPARSSIMRAKEIILVAWGEHKADMLHDAVEGDMDNTCPASLLQMHHNVSVYCDLNAAARLTRIDHPWLVTNCNWDNQLTRRAIIWLCQLTHKPILRLTNRDYQDNGLQELITLYGSAYDCNIKVFNDIQHTITGWPGGKPNADDTERPERAHPFPKDILIFSPHPDDDVISMGGTFQRLIKQGHNVHIAYETSGCIAVDDTHVQYFLDFMNGFPDSSIHQSFNSSFHHLALTDFSPRQLLDLKALIRRGEATAACRHMGLDTSHIHFLNLPFYETGTIKKGDLSQKDVDIVKNILMEIRPQQMFVAGDLADPHGTHKVCLDAVLAAIEELSETEDWLHECRVWMYRGAWMEWEPDLIEMAVPMSPEELRGKRNTILKHQSQMESAPFLGNDERLFWQRAEDRNHATAEMYAQLGLANYEAIEAFVQYRFQKDKHMTTIINQFAIPNQVQDPKPLKVGFINDSFILRAKQPGETSYFLQRINHHIFTNVEGLQRNIQVVTDHIRQKLLAQGVQDIDRRVLRLVPTRDGKLYYQTPEGDYWRMYVLIENASSQEKVTPESAYLAGRAFGEFQCQLSDLKFDALCESIPNFHNIEFRLQQLEDAIRDNKAGRLQQPECQQIIANIRRRSEDMCLAERLFREGKLTKHINHCDTKVNNMMFDAEGHPLCIVDLDTVMPGFVLSDFGDFMRTAANCGDEDDRDLNRVKVNMPIFEAYTKGYLQTATFLTQQEKALLPYGCRLLSYMQAVRFFTDYLNGDTYYKTQYPEHNLVRTRAQMRLLEEQEKSAPEMERIIQALS